MNERLAHKGYSAVRKHRLKMDDRSNPEIQVYSRHEGPWGNLSRIVQAEHRVFADAVAREVVRALRHDLVDFQNRAKGEAPSNPANWIAAWAIRNGIEVNTADAEVEVTHG